MKTSFFPSMKWLVAVLLSVGLLGCASTKANWDTRVGNYTYDQAVAELGPPDKSTTVSNGNKVAEWITDRGARGGVGFGLGSGGYHSGVSTGVGIGHSIGSQHESFLRLTFSPEGKLVEWKRGSR